MNGIAAGGPAFLRRLAAEAGDALVSVFFPGGCRLCERMLTRASRLPICEECLGVVPGAAGTGLCGLRIAGLGGDDVG